MGSCQTRPMGIKPIRKTSEFDRKEEKEKSQVQPTGHVAGVNLLSKPDVISASKPDSGTALGYSPRKQTNQNHILGMHTSQNESILNVLSRPKEESISKKVTYKPSGPISSSRVSEKGTDLAAHQMVNQREINNPQVISFTITRKSQTLLRSPENHKAEALPVIPIDNIVDKRLKILRKDNTLLVSPNGHSANTPKIGRSSHERGSLTCRPSSARRSMAISSMAHRHHHKDLLALVEHGQIKAPAKQIISSSKLIDVTTKDALKPRRSQVSDSGADLLSSKRVKLLHIEDSEFHNTVGSSHGIRLSRFVQQAPTSNKLECSIIDGDAESVGKKASFRSIDTSNGEKDVAYQSSKVAARKHRLASAQPSRRILNLHPEEHKEPERTKPFKLFSSNLPDIRMDHSKHVQAEPTISSSTNQDQNEVRKHKKGNRSFRIDHILSQREPLSHIRNSPGKNTQAKPTGLTELKKWGSMMMPSDLVKHKSSLNLLSKLTHVDHPQQPEQPSVVQNSDRSPNDSKQGEHTGGDHSGPLSHCSVSDHGSQRASKRKKVSPKTMVKLDSKKKHKARMVKISSGPMLFETNLSVHDTNASMMEKE